MRLASQLKTLREANVARASFHEDGSLREVQFAPPPMPAAPATAAEGPADHLPRVNVTGARVEAAEVPVAEERPKDLIRDVLLSPLPQIELDPTDYPPEADPDAEDEPDAEPEA